MRGAASRHRGLTEVIKAIGRRPLTVMDDDRRTCIEVSEVEPTTTELTNIHFIGLPPDTSTSAVPLGPGVLKILGNCAAMRIPRQRGVHCIERYLLGDWLTFDFIGVE